MRYRLRTLLIVVTVIAVILASGVFAMKKVKLSYHYAVDATFVQLPSEDIEFLLWLAKQPGVREPLVSRDNNTLSVMWDTEQPMMGGDPKPDLSKGFVRFGYKGLTRHIEHRERQRRPR
jgi:hypothetical protein